MNWNPPPVPVVRPVAVLGVQEEARTKPLKMRCIGNEDTEDYIVKLWQNVELRTHGLAREMYGSMLASFFNLNTPEIALVDIPSDFGLTQLREDVRKSLSESPGLNFGSKYILGATLFSPQAEPSSISAAARVFCFDMLICNMDWRHPKINLLETDDGFILIDHEQAFPFSRPIMMLRMNRPGWELIKERWSSEHILFSSLKGKSVGPEIEEFVSDLVEADDRVFAAIEAQLPDAWQEDIKTITLYLQSTRDHADLFRRSVQELLA